MTGVNPQTWTGQPADLAACGQEQRQQALVEHLWRAQEQDLERRVSLMEKLLRQASGLDAPRAQASAGQMGGGGEIFANSFEGPFISRGQSIEEGMYIKPSHSHASRAQAAEAAGSTGAAGTSEVERPISKFLAGDHEALFKYVGM
eukprot:TRINITY_DN42408_c0_g1_i1.p1 TRINITY_DN42408_c0_g1~~TRINITY_DN42408_c0_g1_i1.p1  ORF type:complete len:159 (+),score=35.85 TRINITY_DN42408_c0_g1_i1:42-479(+)